MRLNDNMSGDAGESKCRKTFWRFFMSGLPQPTDPGTSAEGGDGGERRPQVHTETCGLK